MKAKSNLIRVYTGTDILVRLLKSELENAGICCIVRNDFNSGLTAGFGGGLPSAIDLLIQESDMMKAEPLINEFLEVNG